MLRRPGPGVRRAVARRRGARGARHRPQHAPSRAFARQEDNLRADDPGAARRAAGRPARRSRRSTRALPEHPRVRPRRAARRALVAPDARRADPVHQAGARAGVRGGARAGSRATCAPTVPALARLNEGTTLHVRSRRARSPRARTTCCCRSRRRRSPTRTSRTTRASRATSSRRARSSASPARAASPTPTRRFFRVQARRRARPRSSRPARPGEQLFGQLALPARRRAPAEAAEATRCSAPAMPCETQEPPDLNAPVGPGREHGRPPQAGADRPTNRARAEGGRGVRRQLERAPAARGEGRAVGRPARVLRPRRAHAGHASSACAWSTTAATCVEVRTK